MLIEDPSTMILLLFFLASNRFINGFNSVKCKHVMHVKTQTNTTGCHYQICQNTARYQVTVQTRNHWFLLNSCLICSFLMLQTAQCPRNMADLS